MIGEIKSDEHTRQFFSTPILILCETEQGETYKIHIPLTQLELPARKIVLCELGFIRKIPGLS